MDVFRYILTWRDLGRIRRPCYICIPRRALLRLFIGIAVQMWLWCLLPTPFMLYTLPVGAIILWQFAAWIRLWRGFRYVSVPPSFAFAVFTMMSLLTRAETHRLLYRLYIWVRYLPYGT